MIKQKLNKCRGVGKALDFGCGQKVYRFKYGLCKVCFREWLYGTDNGQELLKGTIKKAVQKVNKPKTRKYIKWIDKEFQSMKKYVQEEICNPYIRLRDIENYNRCISSGGQIHDAGHMHSVGSTEQLRFCCQNIHGQNRSDNGFKGGNLLNYQAGLIDRFGDKYLQTLLKLKTYSISWTKLDRSELIRIGKTYEHLTKKRIWCFSHEEFNNYKNIINK